MHDLLSCHCSLASSYVVYLYMPMYILIHAYVDTYTCICRHLYMYIQRLQKLHEFLKILFKLNLGSLEGGFGHKLNNLCIIPPF